MFTAIVLNSLVAAVFSGYVPTAAAWVRPKLELAPLAVAVVRAVGVEEPPALVFPPLFVRCRTSSTTRTTPMTDAARYRTMRVPPSRRGEPRPGPG